MEKNPNTGLSDNLETVGEGADGIYEMIFQEIDDAIFYWMLNRLKTITSLDFNVLTIRINKYLILANMSCVV
jgi:hypothetical protein